MSLSRTPSKSLRLPLPLLGAAGLLFAGAACKGKQAATTPDGEGPTVVVPKADPTLCDTNGKNVLTYDLNRDNRPDVWRLYKVEDEAGTKVEYLTCKQVDYDHDGRKDLVAGFDRKGQRLYEKLDMDYDGKFDLTSIYDAKTGVVAEVDRDIDFDGKFDLKELYGSNGVINSVRYDKDGDGEPDEWEQYKDGQLIAIRYDDDYDGKIDRTEEVPGSRPKVEMPTVEDGGAAEAPIPKPQ